MTEYLIYNNLKDPRGFNWGNVICQCNGGNVGGGNDVVSIILQNISQ